MHHYPKDLVEKYLLVVCEASTSRVPVVFDRLDSFSDDEIIDIVFKVILVGVKLLDSFICLLP